MGVMLRNRIQQEETGKFNSILEVIDEYREILYGQEVTVRRYEPVVYLADPEYPYGEECYLGGFTVDRGV